MAYEIINKGKSYYAKDYKHYLFIVWILYFNELLKEEKNERD